jgi:hypothetical protein
MFGFTPAATDPALTTGRRNLLHGLSQKQQAVAAVIAGRLSLLEAAAWFRAAGLGSAIADPRAVPPAEAESLCRSVIGWVHLALCDRPERAETVTVMLEDELECYLDRFGPGRLPATP